ncbi:MAG TPA: dephospho-CoA kinase [Burkholderiales bacterium]|nr:dephospho-CoA kinase [Burkholderiales bacterium]
MGYVIGLTGGIGSGKSAAARMFEELGAAIVDTDQIAHELTRPGGAAMSAIRDRFGPEYIAGDGGLERTRMRRLVFQDAKAKQKLEAILHPLIRQETRARIAAATQPYAVAVVPLLLETGAYREFTDRVLVVDCAEDRQVQRAARRGGVTEDDVRAIMAAQLPRAERLARADDVLSNDGSLACLRRQVQQLHGKYMELARIKSSIGSDLRKPA